MNVGVVRCQTYHRFLRRLIFSSSPKVSQVIAGGIGGKNWYPFLGSEFSSLIELKRIEMN